MSRYDQPTQEPDLDRYEPKPVEDSDVPDFDAPDSVEAALTEFEQKSDARLPPITGGYLPTFDVHEPEPSKPIELVDRAEYAMHNLIDALQTLDQEIATATTLERANQLRKMLKRAWADVTRVTDNAGDQVDRFVEKVR